jgi:hypothetical protein
MSKTAVITRPVHKDPIATREFWERCATGAGLDARAGAYKLRELAIAEGLTYFDTEDKVYRWCGSR